MDLLESEIIADNYSRDNVKRKNADREIKRWFPDERNKWECPACGVMNTMRLHLRDYDTLLVITPRIYPCHNHRCHMRRFYWRNGLNQLLARYLSKYESVDELSFTSKFDPVKFYANLKPDHNPNQLKMF